jgi:hypothetical protein
MESRTRAVFLAALGGAAAASVVPARALAAGNDSMFVVNSRPYDWSTPLDELAPTLFTPNRTFFIRSHMGLNQFDSFTRICRAGEPAEAQAQTRGAP